MPLETVLPVVAGRQQPRIHVVPPFVSSAGVEAIEVAEIAGLFLDPWEKLVLTDALGVTAAGRWAAFRVGLEVARQNGKGAVLEARELAGLFALGERVIIHSAHEQATASEHFRRILNLMEGVPEFDRRILKVIRGKGSEAIELRDNYRIFFKTRTGGGGRGFTGDLVVFDEAMMLAAAFMAALVPLMAARSMVGDPQLWFAGSAVDQQKTDHGIEFARVRADALAEVGRLAYFGWNIPFDDPASVPASVLDDPAMWAMANPGLGIRISAQYIADERSALGSREFAVERLGVGDWPDPSDDADRKIPKADWEACREQADTVDPASIKPVALSFDVSPDRSWSAVSVGGRRADGKWVGAVIKHAPGTDWVVDELAGLGARHAPLAVLWDKLGQANSLKDELEQRRVRNLKPMDTREVVSACGEFFDAVTEVDERGERQFVHIGQPELDAAVDGAGERWIGNAWAWGPRVSTADVSPLVSVTFARWGAETQKPPDPADNIW